ncbi:hypothetical protein AALB47_12150 [Lachnospiraceae bacterium 54-11]
MKNKLVISLLAVNNGLDYAILTGKSPVYPFENNKKISDTPISWKIEVALQGSRLSALTVKVDGAADPLPEISDEEIEANCASLKLLAARFKECSITVYTINNSMVMSATASGVELVNFKK